MKTVPGRVYHIFKLSVRSAVAKYDSFFVGRDSSPRNENSVSVYSILFCSKPVQFTFFH